MKQKVVREEDFIEVLALQEVCQEDAVAWLEALRTPPPNAVDLDLLTKRIIDQRMDLGPEFIPYDGYDRPSDCMPLEDIAVRLIHSFGDLTLAFNLLPKATQVNQTQSRIGSPKLRSVSPQFRGKARSGQLPGAHQARKADIGAEARHMKATKAEGAEDVYTLTERQWLHALRGSSQKRLLSDSDAKAEAARQMAWQSQRAAVATALGMTQPAIDSLHSLFPNLSERLCIAKTAFQPFEAMMVRASLTPCGFFGHRLARDVPVTSVSARHFVKGDVTAVCGSRPFVAVVALGAERALADGGEVEMEYQACLEAASDGTAVAMLRAPGTEHGSGMFRA